MEKAYIKTDTELRRRQTQTGALLGVVLIPAVSSLGYFIYPEYLNDFFSICLLSTLIHLSIYLILREPVSRQFIRCLSVLWALTPAAAISFEIYLTEGSQSSYYAGLSLMIIVTCQLLPYTLKESVMYCLCVLMLYTLACVFHTATAFDPITFYNNVYFIVLTSILSVTISYFYNQKRIKDFRLNHELDLRNKQLEELDKMKSSFFANISHELRTPLTLILAPIQQLLQSKTPPPNRIAELLHTAQDNGLRLLKLVNDLLEVIKLEEGKTKLYFEAIEINAFLSAMTDSMHNIAESRNISIKKELLDGNIVIDADSYALERIFLNLLGNAIKFTPANGTISIRSTVADDTALIEIADTGIGIRTEALPHIFDRFHQAESSNARRYPGSGIGLALVKELVEKMRGQVRAESKSGVGTTLQVMVPLSRKKYTVPDIQAMPTQSDLIETLHRDAERVIPLNTLTKNEEYSRSDRAKPLTLIVNDEPDMRRYLVDSLKDSYNIILASNGKQSLELAQKHRPDLILLDLILPGINGLEACKWLKTDPDTHKIKIILLTTRVDETSKIAALEYGVDDFLTSPFSQFEVQTRLHNLYQTARLEEDLRKKNQNLEQTLEKLQLLHESA